MTAKVWTFYMSCNAYPNEDGLMPHDTIYTNQHAAMNAANQRFAYSWVMFATPLEIWERVWANGEPLLNWKFVTENHYQGTHPAWDDFVCTVAAVEPKSGKL